jgi:hypothetical protein
VLQNKGKIANLSLPAENKKSSVLLLLANFQQMNFTQMHDHLRLELMRRIQRGTLSVSLLARQTGFGQAHLSNFLNCRRQLSLEAMDRILVAQHLTPADLLPTAKRAEVPPDWLSKCAVPLVSHATAAFEALIRPAAVQAMVQVPADALQTARARASSSRRAWQRFVAVRAAVADAQAMEPLVLPEAIALIDRHYNSLLPYRPNRPNLYAVRDNSHLTFRYVDYLSNRLVLRPLNLAYAVQLIEVDAGEVPNEMLVGRVVLVVNEL